MNKRKIPQYVIALILGLSLFGTQDAIELTMTKGMKLNIIPDKDALYIHSEILIKFRETINPAISYLTFLNIFNEKVATPKSSVLNSLFKMGNDFDLILNEDHLLIKVNFLQGKVQLFIQFLKKLFSFGDFSLKKFRYSLTNFRELFFSDKNWERILASQIAQSEIFKDVVTLRDLMLKKKSINNINLSQIRSFYKKNFILPNVTVALEGNINPYIFLGLTEKAFKKRKKIIFKPIRIFKKTLSLKRKVVIVNTGRLKRYPEIFWFIPIPPKGAEGFDILRISNKILFGYPLSAISIMASKSGIRNFKISTSIYNFQNISFLCNRINISRYGDIEKFIFIANNSFRKLIPGRIGKKQYLSSYNFIYLGEKIASDQFDYKVGNLIQKALTAANPYRRVDERRQGLKKDVTFVSFNNFIEKNSDKDLFLKRIRYGVIVIFGDSNTILKNFRVQKAGVLNVY